jgi:hypothetical protein
MTTTNNGRFADRAAQIRTLNKQSGYRKAIDIGRILWRIKPQFANQVEWLSWLKANLPFGQSIANRYMRCFEHRDKLAELPDNAPVIHAYRLVGVATGHHYKKPKHQAAAVEQHDENKTN